ncbi:hypothetical protein CCUS01_10748 [Colletotrichum cuscutae]|uniref:Uncharacterized protein n=1 Tax=Colletotrichum cuscutae TaxID=1209917 RepID=A0AAI9XLT4_9PEZI|nr:hypothetical protein CCUS01_10748 [Colletotrichum cuscutae]
MGYRAEHAEQQQLDPKVEPDVVPPEARHMWQHQQSRAGIKYDIHNTCPAHIDHGYQHAASQPSRNTASGTCGERTPVKLRHRTALIAPPAADVLPHVRSAEYQLLQIRCIPIILPIPSAALRYAVFITQHPNSIRWPASSLSHAPTQGLLPQPCKKPPFRKPKYLIHLATALTNALSVLLLPTAHSPLRFVHAKRPLDPTNKTKVTKPTAAITRARLEKS